MTGCAAVGTNGLILVEPRAAVGDADPTFDSSSERYPFLYETMRASKPKRYSKLIFGTRSRKTARNTKGSYVPRGAIGLQLGPTELDAWLPRMNGATESANVFPLGSTYPYFDVMMSLDNAVTYFRACQVAAYVFQSEASDGEDEDEILNLQLVLIARSVDYSKSLPVTLPAVTEGTGYTPYTHSMLAAELDSTSFDMDKFRLVVDNGFRPKTRNSLTPNCVYAGPRKVNLEVTTPFTSSLWTKAQLAYSAQDGIPGLFTYTSGAKSVSFGFPALHNSEEPPVIRSHEEIPMNLNLWAGDTSTDLEMEVTNVP